MAIEKPAPWIGASGIEYTFHVFGLDPDVPARPGNYIYAKRNAEGAWVPIYMGHGDLATCCTDSALLRCITAKEVTHVHLRLNSREADREAELQDLLAHYANAFAPEGCQPGQGAAADGDAPAKPRSRRVPAKKAATKKTSTKKTAARKAATKAASKASTKKAAGKKASAEKAPAKKTPTTRKPVKKTPAKTAASIKPKAAKPPRPRSR